MQVFAGATDSPPKVGHQFTVQQLMEKIEVKNAGPGSFQHVPLLDAEKVHGAKSLGV